MLDFEVQRCTRRCAASDRELLPGETFYSVLLAEGSQVVRYDYAAEAWSEPPAEAIGWWKSRMPEPNAHKLHWAPGDVMLHYFEQLAGEPAQADVRYLLTLLMIRRRVFRLEDTVRDEQGGEQLLVFCGKNEQEYQVPVVAPSENRIQEIQEELARLLFAEAA